MKMYVARDLLNGEIYLFKSKSERAMTYWSRDMVKFKLEKTMFPNLK